MVIIGNKYAIKFVFSLHILEIYNNIIRDFRSLLMVIISLEEF